MPDEETIEELMPSPHDVVKVQNPTEEDFTHEYGGEEFTIKAGETKPMPFYLAKHMAKHLAKRELQKNGEKPFNREVFPMADKYMVDLYQRAEEEEKVKTQGELAKERVAELEEEQKEAMTGTEVADGFKCEVCGFVSKSKSGLMSHMRKHEREGDL